MYSNHGVFCELTFLREKEKMKGCSFCFFIFKRLDKGVDSLPEKCSIAVEESHL